MPIRGGVAPSKRRQMSSSSDSAPPPEESNNNSPPDNSSSSPSPPSSDSSPPPPPSSDGSSGQSPPPSSDNSSPPPPSSDNSSPPPPSTGSSSSSPPPPSNDDNGGSSSGNSSPPPPKSSGSSGNNGNSGSSNNNGNSGSSGSSGNSPSPPSSNHSPSSSSSSGALAPPRSSSSSSSDSNSNHTSQIVTGVAVGGSLLLIMFILCCVMCRCGKKKKRKHQAMNYYSGPPKGSMMYSGEYYPSSQQPPQWQTNDHVVKFNSPQGGGWPAPPPPPPMMSGEMSGNYSGPHQPPLPPPSPAMALGFNKSTFTYDELAQATGGFSQGNLLGQGGFGYVHKGVLPSGKEIAVKSLKIGSGQGEREFQAEVEIISRVHHRHLVSLVGYCIAGGQRMLVYEFVPNNTLEYHLHGKDRPVMDWPFRLRIALGSAKGLAYLHEDCHPRIIHRDIKTANILIDSNFEAMVADFGLAKLSSDNYTHVSTRVMGTFGYLAPEYAASGKLTEKSDVFSFGVMVLELITGKRPVDNNRDEDDCLVDWARPLLTRALEDGNYDELVDPRLGNNYDRQEMARLIACAAACIRHSGRRRPRMSQIARALEGDVSLEALNETGKPTGQSTVYSSSSDYDTAAYNSDMAKFRKTAFASGDLSSEYTGSTGEFGNNTSSSSGEMGQSGKPAKGF
ncbi:hypothetical protein QQ045_008557 [Rhodiola kirilowii]